jgi:hypothetical protein
MKSRFLPYATTPGRLTAQVVSDLLVGLWTALWVSVGLGVHHAVATIAGVGNGPATATHAVPSGQ